MTRLQFLEDALSQVLENSDWADQEDKPYPEFHPGVGWFLVFPESRWFYDDGEYLGSNYREAIKTIKKLF